MLRVRGVEGTPDDLDVVGVHDDEPFDSLMKQAESAHVTGRFRLARDLFRRARELEPEDVEVLVKLATSHHALGDPEAAWRWLDRALRIAPRAFDPWYSKGMFLIAEERHAEATDAFRTAAGRSSGALRARAVNSLGLALLALGRRDEAIRAFERAAGEPTEVDALVNRAVLHLEDGWNEHALGLLDEALGRDPTAGIAHYNRARALIRLRRTSEALDAVIAAEKNHVRRTLCDLQRVRLRLLEGREAEARALLVEVCREPSPPPAALRLLELLEEPPKDPRYTS
jgi:tetratricopeptide (TPR) repeat protein